MKTQVTRRRALATGTAFALAPFGAKAAERETVGMQLILATDVSGSVNPSRYKTQQDGYVEALGDPRVLGVIHNSTRRSSPSPSLHGSATRRSWSPGRGSKTPNQSTPSATA